MFFFIFITFPLDHVLILWGKNSVLVTHGSYRITFTCLQILQLPVSIKQALNLFVHGWFRPAFVSENLSLLTYVQVTLLSLDYKLYCYSLASSMSGIFSIFLNKLSNVDLLQVPRTLNNFVLSILIFLYLKKYKARVIRVMIWITYLVDKKTTTTNCFETYLQAV